MAVTKAEIRSGAYYDSVILMQLQRSLAALPDVLDAGVVMGTDANKDILAQSGLLTSEGKRRTRIIESSEIVLGSFASASSSTG